MGLWKAIGADTSTLSWIAYGYKFRFHEEPAHLSFKNGPSLQEESAQTFVTEETDTCIADGSFRLVDPSFAKVVNPSHVVPKANGKLRWIADCRHTNGQCAYAQFSLSSLRKDLHSLLLKDDDLLVFDLAKAYYSVGAHPDSWPYLCMDTPRGLVCGSVLLFGVGQSPFCFHKITRCIVEFAGAVGVRVLSYLDDFL